MGQKLSQDFLDTISILKKVEEYEFGHEYRRFLFIMAIIGLIALFGGYMSYFLNKFVQTDITLILIGAGGNSDPVLFLSSWLIQIAILTSLIIYTKTSKGLLDTWTPFFKSLGIVWGIIYISTFLVNVSMYLISNELGDNWGASLWSFSLGLAFLLSVRVLKPLPHLKLVRQGFIVLTIFLWILSPVLSFIEWEVRMLTLCRLFILENLRFNSGVFGC